MWLFKSFSCYKIIITEAKKFTFCVWEKIRTLTVCFHLSTVITYKICCYRWASELIHSACQYFRCIFFQQKTNIFVSLMWILTAREFQFILMKWLLMNIFHIFNIQSIDIIKMLTKFVALQILIRKVWFSAKFHV